MALIWWGLLSTGPRRVQASPDPTEDTLTTYGQRGSGRILTRRLGRHLSEQPLVLERIATGNPWPTAYRGVVLLGGWNPWKARGVLHDRQTLDDTTGTHGHLLRWGKSQLVTHPRPVQDGASTEPHPTADGFMRSEPSLRVSATASVPRARADRGDGPGDGQPPPDAVAIPPAATSVVPTPLPWRKHLCATGPARPPRFGFHNG
jgi:hypothetical protein